MLTPIGYVDKMQNLRCGTKPVSKKLNNLLLLQKFSQISILVFSVANKKPFEQVWEKSDFVFV